MSLLYWSYKLIGLAGLTVGVFLLPHVMPGPLLSLYESWPVNPQQRARLIQEHGFDRSLPAQYAIWVRRLITGHWGTSRYSNRAVLEESWSATCRTLLLCVWTGLLCAVGTALCRVGQRLMPPRLWYGRAQSLYYLLGALPGFLIAVLLREGIIWQLGWGSMVSLPLFEPAYFLHPSSMLLPATILALPMLRAWHTRPSVLPLPSSQRSRWLSAPHVGRLLHPHLEMFFLELCLIEYVCSFPGLGSLGIDALKRHDVPLLQGFILCTSCVYFIACCLCERGAVAAIQAIPPPPSRISRATLPVPGNVGIYSNLWYLCILGGLTLGAPWLSLYDPMEMHTHDQFLAPGYRYIFGTDFLGRDIMSRTLKGFYSSIPRVAYLTILLGGISWLVSSSSHGVRNLLKRIWMSGCVFLQAIPHFILAFMLFLVFEHRARALDIAIALACLPLATQLMAGRTTLLYRACQCVQLSERLLILEVIFYFLNLTAESFTPTWGSDIRHGMHYGHMSIWILLGPMLAVVWSRYILSRVGDTYLAASWLAEVEPIAMTPPYESGNATKE